MEVFYDLGLGGIRERQVEGGYSTGRHVRHGVLVDMDGGHLNLLGGHGEGVLPGLVVSRHVGTLVGLTGLSALLDTYVRVVAGRRVERHLMAVLVGRFAQRVGIGFRRRRVVLVARLARAVDLDAPGTSQF